MVNGQEVNVSGCVPDTNNVQSLFTEECTGSSRWFYDEGNTNLAFLKQRYYYIDESSTNQYVTACEPSATSYTVALSSTNCPAIHDDANLRSNVHQKPLALLDPDTLTTEEIVGEGCRDTGNLVSYTQNGGQWRIIGNFTNASITPGNVSSVSASQASWSPMPENGCVFCGFLGSGPWVNSGDETKFCLRTESCLNTTIIPGPAWCTEREAKAPWHFDLVDVDLNIADSDATPQIGDLRHNGRISDNRSTRFADLASQFAPSTGDGPFNATCTIGTKPVCANVAHLEKNTNYVRPDSTNYVNINGVLGTTYVCGLGTNLNGTIEP